MRRIKALIRELTAIAVIPEFPEGYRCKIFIFGLPGTIMNTVYGLKIDSV